MDRRLVWPWLALLAADFVVVRDLAAPAVSVRSGVNFGASALALLGLLVVLARLAKSRAGTALAFLLLALPLVLQASHYAVYEAYAGAFAARFLLDSPELSVQLARENAHVGKTLASVAVAAGVVAWLRLRCRPPGLGWVAAGLALPLFWIPFSWLNWYGASEFQNSVIAAYGIPVELYKDARLHRIYGRKPPVPPQPADGPLPSIVLVIGESTVLDHLGLYGYERDTTPNLSRLARERKLVAFDNCVSIGPVTRISVPYMLVGLTGPDPQGRVYAAPTIFDYAKARGYHTALITAQELKWGGLERLLVDGSVDHYRRGVDFDPQTTVLKGADDFEVLTRGIEPFLARAREPFLLVVQMDGSHYPYSQHSPAAFKRFLPETADNDVNAYDNTLVYSDAFLDRLQSAVRAKAPGAWMFFSPDHGQNIEGGKARYHLKFSTQVVHNPLIVFPPAEHQAQVEAQRSSPCSQADLVATALDLMQMQPVVPIDGLSLRRPIDPGRLRFVSGWMATELSESGGLLVRPDLTWDHVDFGRGAVTPGGDGRVIPYAQWPREYRALFEETLRADGTTVAAAAP